jgi:hypothetical protein
MNFIISIHLTSEGREEGTLQIDTVKFKTFNP